MSSDVIEEKSMSPKWSCNLPRMNSWLRNVFFFHVHLLVIEKMGDALGNLHDEPPWVVV